MAEQAIHDGTGKRSVTRLYRGLSRSYRPEQVDTKELLHGTNFADCPMAALVYARGRNGVLLVVDVPEDAKIRMYDAIWSLDGLGPRRVMLRGCPFDPYIVAEVPAKELRAEVRKRGVRTLTDSEKGRILDRYLEQRISGTLNNRAAICCPRPNSALPSSTPPAAGFWPPNAPPPGSPSTLPTGGSNKTAKPAY